MVNNTKYGSGALQNNTGINNTAVGAYTAYSNLDASNNTSVGSNSAYYTTTGSNNTSLGAGSLCNNTTGALNTAIGSSALEGPLPIGSVGNQNTAVGAQALYTNQGNLNTAIGAFSALGVTGGNYNTFLGANSSTLNNATYSYSTAIGYNALIDASNQIMIGGTGPNGYPNVIIPGQAFLTNYIATGNDEQIVPKSYVDLVAIGLKITQTCLCATTGDINLAFTTAPASTNTDGINFASLPDGNYNVLVVSQGATTTPPSLTSNADNGVYILNKSSTTYTWSRPISPAPMYVGYNALGAFSFIQGGTNYGKKGLVQYYKDPTTGIANVGLDPLQYQTFYQLDVNAGRGLSTEIISQQLYLNVDTSLNFVNFLDSNTSVSGANGTLSLGTNTNNSIIIGPTGTSVPIKTQSIIQAQQGITGATGSFNNVIIRGATGKNPLLVIGNNPNVGQVTTAAFIDISSDYKADIAIGLNNPNNLVIAYKNPGYPVQSQGSAFISTYGGQQGAISIDGSGVAIGYGESKPPNSFSYKLDVSGGIISSGIICRDYANSSPQSYIDIGSQSGVNYIESFGNSLSVGSSAPLYFTNGYNANQYMAIVPNSPATTANIGIGTTTPQYTLDVNGSINFTGSIYKSGAAYNPGFVPTGAVFYFAMSSAPSGYLQCDGTAVSRTTYSALFTAIGTTWGAGDGSTTFNLPNLLGQFIRGWNNIGSGTDSGRTLSNTPQASQFGQHNHGVTDPGHIHSITDPSHNHDFAKYGDDGTGPVVVGNVGIVGYDNQITGPISGNMSGATTGITINLQYTGITTQNAGGNETRPTNIALLACIKT